MYVLSEEYEGEGLIEKEKRCENNQRLEMLSLLVTPHPYFPNDEYANL